MATKSQAHRKRIALKVAVEAIGKPRHIAEDEFYVTVLCVI